MCCFSLFMHANRARMQLRALINQPGRLTQFLTSVACTWIVHILKHQALRHADMHLKQNSIIQNLFSVCKSDLEIHMKSESAVREVVRHYILNKNWEEFCSAEIFSLSFWRNMSIVLAECQGTSTAADCCSPLCCNSGSTANVWTMSQISKVTSSDF